MNDSRDLNSMWRSFLPLSLALLLLLAVLAALSLLTLGFVGVVIALVLAMGIFIASQYLLWGWWLGPYLRAQERLRQAEEDDVA
jgi:hypothetical protein